MIGSIFHVIFLSRNVQYDGFQWRVNVVRDCIESYVSDEESSKLYAFFNSFADSSKKSVSLNQFLSRVAVLFFCRVFHYSLFYSSMNILLIF